jgi:DNA-binding response OmpR family regulator
MSKNILIIEDDNLIIKLLTQKFESEGYSVSHATNGQEGFNLIQAKNPDLVMLDIMLPGGMNGFDVLEQLRRTGLIKKIPVVVMSSLTTEKDTALKIGAKDYIVKTEMDIDKLAEKINKLLSG